MLTCDELRKSFGGVRALDGVSLQLEQQGVVGIIGPNGAGKTTLFHILSGLLRPDAGRCRYGDRDITRLPAHRIARLGIARTFQDLRLISRLTALENVQLARPGQRGEGLLRAVTRLGVAAEERENRAAALHCLRSVGLETKADEPASELSYGQQKLLTLACCLARNAQVLLLDEPVAGVHPELAARILELLTAMAGAGKLVVFIEHDLEAVKRVADRVILMDHGKVIASGTPDAVMSDPAVIAAYVA